MIVRVFADPPLISDITTPGLWVRGYATSGDVAKALAFLQWNAATQAVVDLGLHGQLGEDVVSYIAERHPVVGLWGITSLCPRDWPVWATERCRRVFPRVGAAWLTEIVRGGLE